MGVSQTQGGEGDNREGTCSTGFPTPAYLMHKSHIYTPVSTQYNDRPGHGVLGLQHDGSFLDISSAVSTQTTRCRYINIYGAMYVTTLALHATAAGQSGVVNHFEN